jgi:hypothetical protein
MVPRSASPEQQTKQRGRGIVLHAFIDESGDDGFAPRSSRWLILGAYIIRESDMNPVKEKIAEGVSRFGRLLRPLMFILSIAYTRSARHS